MRALRYALFAAALMTTDQLELLHGQLAITEVMADSATNRAQVLRGPDYWELTNFGTEDRSLDGYGFSDDKTNTVFTGVFDNLTIKSGESIIFCRANGSTPSVQSKEDFVAWWGANNLPADLQVRFYSQPGLSGDGDQIWLRDREGNVVDTVTFGMSIPGRSITYDIETSAFEWRSAPNVHGAFSAASSTDDVGSPGSTTGRVPLSFLRHPESQSSDGCGGVEFSVVAGGVPRPSYQWTSNSIPIPGATASRLKVGELQSAASIDYRVLLNNGIEKLRSDVAKLVINTSPHAPEFTLYPKNTSIFPGQTGQFFAEVRGHPCASLQWRSNNVVLSGETNPTLVVPVPSDSPLGTTLYTLTVSNEFGTTSTSAQLAIIKMPCLKITEVMAYPANEDTLNHKGWFELTNCDTVEANLQNYRFRDIDDPTVAFTITNHIVLRPGESMIFVEAMSHEAFIDWWGAELPPGLQVVTWRGWGLSKTATSSGETLYIWNPHPNDPWNNVASASYLNALQGFSQETTNECYETQGCFATSVRESVLGENGAFRASVGGDIGSPGYTSNLLGVLEVSAQANRILVWCHVAAGKKYRLSFKKSLTDVNWVPLKSVTAEGTVTQFQDAPLAGTSARFYRVEEIE